MCASISKLVTATLALQACEKGLLRLDEDVNNHLPSTCCVLHPSHPKVCITARHLLTHRSGLGDNELALRPNSRWRECNSDPTITLMDYVSQRLCMGGEYSQEVRWSGFVSAFYRNCFWGTFLLLSCNIVLVLSTRKPPGEAPYHYSNAGLTLLGFVVQCATKTPLEQLAQKWVFDPCKMTNTSFTLRGARAKAAVHALPHTSRGLWYACMHISYLCALAYPFAAFIASILALCSRIRGEPSSHNYFYLLKKKKSKN